MGSVAEPNEVRSSMHLKASIRLGAILAQGIQLKGRFNAIEQNLIVGNQLPGIAFMSDSRLPDSHDSTDKLSIGQLHYLER